MEGSLATPHNPLSSTEIFQGGTDINGGFRFEELFIPSGVSIRELNENLDNALVLGADGVTQPTFSFTAETINPNGNANVTMLVRWKEVS